MYGERIDEQVRTRFVVGRKKDAQHVRRHRALHRYLLGLERNAMVFRPRDDGASQFLFRSY